VRDYICECCIMSKLNECLRDNVWNSKKMVVFCKIYWRSLMRDVKRLVGEFCDWMSLIFSCWKFCDVAMRNLIKTSICLQRLKLKILWFFLILIYASLIFFTLSCVPTCFHCDLCDHRIVSYLQDSVRGSGFHNPPINYSI
jgi:hypothetical protein